LSFNLKVSNHDIAWHGLGCHVKSYNIAFCHFNELMNALSDTKW
jgi:hypothetical protein